MTQEQRNKEFIINYVSTLSNTKPTRDLLEKYMTDEALIGHIEFFEAAFPGYEIQIDEMIAEGNRVVIQGRFKGTQLGEFSGIRPTGKTVEFPVVVRYEIEDDKIVNHWSLADQMSMMEQLGVLPSEVLS